MGNTILLADKSITIQKIVELTFADENYTIKCVNDGQTALETIPQISPSVILADISLPGKNGYELCHALRTDPAFVAFANVPVILLAGIYETMDEERARQVQERVREVGANDLLSKPFDPQALTAKVKEFLEAPAAPSANVETTGPMDAIFASAPPTSEQYFTSMDTPVPEPVQQPPDDEEKTMMLPNASNIFAEAPPFDYDKTDPGVPLNIEEAKPLDEPVFDAAQMDSMPAVDFGAEEEPVEEEEPAVVAGDSFTGVEETEFAMPDSPFGEREEPAFETEPPTAPYAAAPIIGGDEPFGDVFGEEPAAQSWSTSAATEEETPFGLPEPPPMPPAPEPEPVPEPVQAAAEEPVAEEPVVEEQWMATSEPVGAADFAMDEGDREQAGEILQGSIKPDFGEDTWSRAKAQVAKEQPVEELFESPEPDVSQEAEELQPDFVEKPFVSAEAHATAPENAAAVVPSGGPVNITDDLVEKIAERVIAKLSERVVSDIVWQVVPDLAEKMIRREIEKLNAGGE